MVTKIFHGRTKKVPEKLPQSSPAVYLYRDLENLKPTPKKTGP
jgi:hypothetical protein